MSSAYLKYSTFKRKRIREIKSTGSGRGVGGVSRGRGHQENALYLTGGCKQQRVEEPSPSEEDEAPAKAEGIGSLG